MTTVWHEDGWGEVAWLQNDGTIRTRLINPSHRDCDCFSMDISDFPKQVTHMKLETAGYAQHLRECLVHPREPTQRDLKRKREVRLIKARRGQNNNSLKPNSSPRQAGPAFDPWANCLCDVSNGENYGDLPPVRIQGQPCTTHARCCWYCHCGMLIADAEDQRRGEREKDRQGQNSVHRCVCDDSDSATHPPWTGRPTIRIDGEPCSLHDGCCHVCHFEMLKADEEDRQERQRLRQAQSDSGARNRIATTNIQSWRDEVDRVSPRPAIQSPIAKKKKKSRGPKKPKNRESYLADIRPIFNPFKNCVCDLSQLNHIKDKMSIPTRACHDGKPCTLHERCCTQCHAARIEGDPCEREEREKKRQDLFAAYPNPSESPKVQVVIVSPNRPAASSSSRQPVKSSKHRYSDSSKTSGAIKKARKSDSSALKAARLYTKQECAKLFDERDAPRSYESQTIARDILRAVGIHPTIPPLNAHIQ